MDTYTVTANIYNTYGHRVSTQEFGGVVEIAPIKSGKIIQLKDCNDLTIFLNTNVFGSIIVSPDEKMS